MKIVKRVIAGVLIVVLAAGGIYTGLRHVKESKVTEVPVTSVSNLQTDWYSETTLDGAITTNVTQNVNMDKDMIIDKIYVSEYQSVCRLLTLVTGTSVTLDSFTCLRPV